MMKSVILALKPGSRFHFGKLGIDINSGLADTDEWLHSDVLFSAIVNNLASVKKTEFVNQFIQHFRNGAIKISSGFYCIERDGEFEYLLPKPVNATKFIADYNQIKSIKKIQFLSHKLWDKHPTKWEEDGILTKNRKAMLSGNDENRHIFSLFNKEIIPNLTIHKPTNDVKGPFPLAVIQIPDLGQAHVHFYFLYEMTERFPSEMADAFRFAMDLIAFNGLGGKRSSGCGFIEKVEWQETLYPISLADSGLMTNVGLYIPTEAEFKYCLFYDYKTRGGRKTKDNATLKRVRMLTEGSIIQATEAIAGLTEYLTEDKTHLRYGQPLCLTLPKFYGNEYSN